MTLIDPKARDADTTHVEEQRVAKNDAPHKRGSCTGKEASPPIRWGTQDEFTARYEGFLDTVYCDAESHSHRTGRELLADSVAAEIRRRGATRVLDCAAGTGFPALDLAVDPPVRNFVIHCTDSDRSMLDVLQARVENTFGPENGLKLDELAPPIDRDPGVVGIDQLVLDWADLDRIRSSYDYVMCRGNSLVYADTWSGGKDVASKDRAEWLLRKIAGKVRRGGYLHIDAPRSLTLRSEEYTKQISSDGGTTVWESVQEEGDSRQWRLSFKSKTCVLKFERRSSLLTIDDVSLILKDIGFLDSDPIELKYERPGFGVIIAQRPR